MALSYSIKFEREAAKGSKYAILVPVWALGVVARAEWQTGSNVDKRAVKSKTAAIK